MDRGRKDQEGHRHRSAHAILHVRSVEEGPSPTNFLKQDTEVTERGRSDYILRGIAGTSRHNRNGRDVASWR